MIGCVISLGYPNQTTKAVDIDQLASAHCQIEKAVSDLSHKIEALQL